MGRAKSVHLAQRFERNQVIYSVGDPPEAIYLIESGLMKVSQLSNGKEQITGIYQKGDLFGEICFCEKSARGNQATRLPGSQPENGGVQLPVSLTHQQLANLVNTPNENVTTIMNEFRREGLLEYSRGRILVFPSKTEEKLN